MAQLIKLDLARPSNIVKEGNVIRELTRAFRVAGLVGSMASYDLNEALLAAGLPQPWEVHPQNAQLRVAEYIIDQVDAGGVLGRVVYRNAEHVDYAGSSSADEYETDRDVNNQPIEVQHFGWVVQNTVPVQGVVVPADQVTQTALIRRRRFEPVLVASRVRPSLIADANNGLNAYQHQLAWQGKANSNSFLGSPPGTWLIVNVAYANEGWGDLAWRFTYEFQRRLTTWDDEVFWALENGKPAPGLIPGQGRKTVAGVVRTDFGPLALTLGLPT